MPLKLKFQQCTCLCLSLALRITTPPTTCRPAPSSNSIFPLFQYLPGQEIVLSESLGMHFLEPTMTFNVHLALSQESARYLCINYYLKYCNFFFVCFKNSMFFILIVYFFSPGSFLLTSLFFPQANSLVPKVSKSMFKLIGNNEFEKSLNFPLFT